MKLLPLLCVMVLAGCSAPRGLPPLPTAARPKSLATPKSLSDPSVTLAWDASPDPSVSGYKIYQGPTSGVYTNHFDAGPALTYTVSNLTAGVTLFYAATAYSTNGLESAFSNEVSYAPPTNGAPASFQITAQTSAAPDGTWVNQTNWVVPNTGSNSFWRLVISPIP